MFANNFNVSLAAIHYHILSYNSYSSSFHLSYGTVFASNILVSELYLIYLAILNSNKASLISSLVSEQYFSNSNLAVILLLIPLLRIL